MSYSVSYMHKRITLIVCSIWHDHKGTIPIQYEDLLFSPSLTRYAGEKAGEYWRYPHSRSSLHYHSYHSHLQARYGVVHVTTDAQA